MNRTTARAARRNSTWLWKRAERNLRARIAAAFGEIARGVDERTAYEQTRDFYRSSGAPWSRALS
jgi:hypothetical protein